MSSKSETGHSKNVANFRTLIVTVEGFGEKYKPARESIALPALHTTEEAGRDAINAINEFQPIYARAISARETAIEPIGKLARRIVNALKSTDAPQKTIDAARSLCDRINGTRRHNAKSETHNAKSEAENATHETVKPEPEAGEKTPREISTAQTSFDRKLENFDRLIKLLQATPEYTPNEDELKTESLVQQCTQIETINMTVITNAKKMSNLRIERDRALYEENIGLVIVASNVKSYLRSIFNVNSSEYKQVSALQFTRKKK